MAVKPPPDGILFQEYLTDPFWMLVACQLVNLTTWVQAKPAFLEILRRFPTPEKLSRARPQRLHRVLRPLGLWRRRSITLVKFANAWCVQRPLSRKDVLQLPGCGQYASASWAIFVEGDTSVEVTDGKLAWYIQEATNGRRHRPAQAGLGQSDFRREPIRLTVPPPA